MFFRGLDDIDGSECQQVTSMSQQKHFRDVLVCRQCFFISFICQFYICSLLLLVAWMSVKVWVRMYLHMSGCKGASTWLCTCIESHNNKLIFISKYFNSCCLHFFFKKKAIVTMSWHWCSSLIFKLLWHSHLFSFGCK